MDSSTASGDHASLDARGDLKRFLTLLAGAVGLTLLIGCANLASLLLARVEERSHELAIRAALGAGRRRVSQEIAAEAGILAVAGGAAALAVGWLIDQALSAFALPGGVQVGALRSGAGLRTAVFAMLATMVAATIVAIAPVVHLATSRLALAVKSRNGGSPKLRATRALVAVQVTVCIVLVSGAGLFLRSLSNALSTDVGFAPAGLLSAAIAVPPARAIGSVAATDALVDRVRALPGISAVTAGPLPLVRGSDTRWSEVRVDGVPLELPEPIEVVYAAADYFTTLRQTLVRGRDFDQQDTATARPVAIINEAAALQLWRGTAPLDHRLGASRAGSDFAVVGVVRDAKLRNLREQGRPVVYLARRQHQAYLSGYMAGSGSSFLIVRTSLDLSQVRPPLSRLAAEAGLSLQTATTLEHAVDEMLMPQRLGRALLTWLGAMALTLTLVGIHGLVSCLVARSTKAIGIRLALGADARNIVGALLRRTFVPLAAGTVGGSAIALYAGRFADRFMYGISGTDPVVIAMTCLTIVGTGLLAALVPAWRALRIDPIKTLRSE